MSKSPLTLQNSSKLTVLVGTHLDCFSVDELDAMVLQLGSAPKKLTCRRTSQVWSHHQNSKEAGVSKDTSGPESLAPS
ncbi:hypothetical protein Tco_0801802 [Tanacetum coccineum]|uniref:Uncharacterized protein n=1 Tax=Tanacetum coccineum TaxID=301880 RepID=A0ABQ4ZX01_9ASTR